MATPSTIKFPGQAGHLNIANIAVGGQHGVGNHLAALSAATPLTLPAVIPIVTSVPKMFQSIEGLPTLIKDVFERHAHAINGIDPEVTLDVNASPIGKDGQELETPTSSKITQPSPSFTWPEVTGNPIFRLMELWIQMIRDPSTQRSMAADETSALTVDRYAMTMLFIQPDATMLAENIIDAFFITNMFPKGTGSLGIEKDRGESRSPERSINFSGVMQRNARTRQVGINIMKGLNIAATDWNYAAPIQSSIEQTLAGAGLESEVSAALGEQTA